jgi:hypothetical protein
MGATLSLIPFDPTNPQTPNPIAFPLRHGDIYQNVGSSLPSLGVYFNPAVVLNNAPSPSVSFTVP